MKPDPTRTLTTTAKQLVTWVCVAGQVTMAFPAVLQTTGVSPATANKAQPAAVASSAGEPAPIVHVNRTTPDVHPPRLALEFSSSPTAEEFFRARVFEEPLVPIGGEPTIAENRAFAVALLGYAKRTGPDDFSSLTGFLAAHPHSPWRAALLTDLGLEYYTTAHYSLALEAWSQAWPLAEGATDPKGKAIADRAVGELAYMYARLGRMTELEALLASVQSRVFSGPATEKISGARGGLSEMKQRPEVSFRCGPLALHRIMLSLHPENAGTAFIHDSASTQKGFSLLQVAALSQKLGLNFQMAHREHDAAFVVPSVVHWKVGHYAALIRQEGDRYLLQDPTFKNDVWATRDALEAETSGYFLVPPDSLGTGWRTVAAKEGETIWGKGNVPQPDPFGPSPSPSPPCPGMAVPTSELLFVSLTLVDEPVGYSPPVGPSVRFVVHYNQRDNFQPANFAYSNFGPKWTFDWLSYITDNPGNPNADAQYYRMGGFSRLFTGFNTNSQTYGFQQYDRTMLTRTSTNSYEMLSPDGSKKIFAQSDGSAGSSRKIFLTQMVDPFGNAVTLTYDANLRIVAITDAIGQVTTLIYSNTNDLYKITRVTDPFGRFATFDYDAANRLSKITDVIGLTSQFTYDTPSGDFINALITPYGTNSFTKAESGTTRSLETLYPDGNRERVEFNQSETVGIPGSDPVTSVPTGMATHNSYLFYRNTYYWSKIACATAYGDYTKAKIYHWLHTADLNSASGILESVKEPLENRVWYDYAGQSDSIVVGSNSLPIHVGRVLDDGSTQLYANQYNGFGKLTNLVDPVGRTFSYVYASNGIDLLETRMTRVGANELLSQKTYNAQHLPLTVTDASGQTTSYTYNSRGQLLTATSPRGDVTTYVYDSNGYRTSVDGPLPGAGDTRTWTHDSFGRVRTKTDVDGYTLTFDRDALNRVTKVTFPDSTFEQLTFTRLDQTLVADRAGRLTSFEYNGVRQMTKRTDPLGRTTLFGWCKCGDAKSLTDPMGRTTTWLHDVQGRVAQKQFADGSRISYIYENTTSRLSQRIDEKLQTTRYNYNRDDTMSVVSYSNAIVATASTSYAYDTNYQRLTLMADNTGTTLFSYYPIPLTPGLGAGRIAAVDGPLPNDTITYSYDELGRTALRAVDGVAVLRGFDAAGRVTNMTNALGSFVFSYDGSTRRQASITYPNSLTTTFSYFDNLSDRWLQRATHTMGATPFAEYTYGYNIPARRITTWSQQSGTASPLVYSFAYDPANQLLSASIAQDASVVQSFSYSYDPAGNRLVEQVDATTNQFSYNSLNEVTTQAGIPLPGSTNQWDAEHRLVSVQTSNHVSQFTYDGFGRRVGIREVLGGVEVSNSRYLWIGSQLCEERNAAGQVVKRFFPQGMTVESGADAGKYCYIKDHLHSVRGLIDDSGTVRARYDYEPYGARSKVLGDMEADFGFTGHFYHGGTGLSLTKYRAYDPKLGRWLSRDPLPNAEIVLGPNLFSYLFDNPVRSRDPLGLSGGGAGEVCKQIAGQAVSSGLDKYADGAGSIFDCGMCVASGFGDFPDCAQCLLALIPPPGPPAPASCYPDDLSDDSNPCVESNGGGGGGSGDGPTCPEPPGPPPAPAPVCSSPPAPPPLPPGTPYY